MIAEGLDLPGQVVQQAMQSFSGQNVLAFIELLQKRRELFSAQDLVDLAELIIYDEVTLSESERSDVETYLADKWGITLP